MYILKSLIDVVLHLDKHLEWLVQNYGMWTYGLIFLIIFCETGLVVTPFLPGDSLLFALGAASGAQLLNWETMAMLVFAAAVIGDAANYWIGNLIGPKIFTQQHVRFFNKKHLERTHQFYEKYGGKTIILARFIPIIRTFAPFVAGIGQMSYKKFFVYNVTGALLWVSLVFGGGYWLGENPIVKKNFSMVILLIIVISILPAVWEVVSVHLKNRRQS